MTAGRKWAWAAGRGAAERRPAEPSAAPDEAEAVAEDPGARLVEQIQAGIDVEGNFERLHGLFEPRLVAYFHRLGFAPEVAQDLTQEVFLRVFRGIHTYERRSRLARWLFEIAHNVYANELRRLSALKREGDEVPLLEERPTEEGGASARPLVSSAPSPLDALEHGEAVAALWQAVGTLPPQMRACVSLRLGQDLKYREIAEVLRMSLDGVKAQLGQAKIRLRRLLAGGEGPLAALTENDGDEAEEVTS